MNRRLTRLLACATLPVSAACLQAQSAPSPDNSEAVVLNPFMVEATPSKGYSSTTVSSATRLNTQLVDVPQSISVINNQFIHDLGVGSLDYDTELSYASGVNFRSYSAGQVTIRGFESYVNFEDGVRLPDTGTVPTAGGGATFLPDLVSVDHVEIIKGPASAIVGRGTVGGLLNFVTNKPTLAGDRGTLTITGGSDQYADAQLDYNAVLPGTGGTAAMRVDMDALHSDYYRQDTSQIKNFALDPSLLWRPTQNTDVLVQLQYHDSTQPCDFGMPYDSIDGRWPSFSYSNSEPYAQRQNTLQGLRVSISHAFNQHISLHEVNSIAQLDDTEGMVWSTSINKAVAGNADGYPVGEVYFTRQLQHNDYSLGSFVSQGDLLAQFDIEPLHTTSQTLLSYEYSATREENVAVNYALSDISWDAPVYGTPPTNPQLVNYSLYKNALYGLVVSEQLSAFDDRLILTAGLRRDALTEGYTLNQINNTSVSNPDTSITHPRIGAVVKILPNVSLYAVYSKNAQPPVVVYHFPGIPFNDPRNSSISEDENGYLREAGIKTDLMNKAVSLTVALYKMEQFGGVTTTAFGPAANNPATAGLLESILLPEARTQGVEIEGTGSLFNSHLTFTGQFQEIASQQFLNNLYVQFRGLPHWTGNLFANYDFRDNPRASGFAVHAGAIFQGVQQADNTNTPLSPGLSGLIHSQPHYDAGAAYNCRRWGFQLNVLNVTNSITPTEFNAYRANNVLPPRQIRLTVTYNL